ncbi:laccase domain protein [Sulfuriferula plumbiphila]|uniref:Purine nucleoside phosphorylase n=1 Tax=Sulfuriferula plumbiphila TaxID=171865 RepID=A0A512LAZ1_9PROT|nr:peptidoglycan editing factor PgeF [Sulfuriferula plumbiphila]BBP03923.1 laccase domain protein [Sulfuriferula plumbiphila]GEP31654.1 laccase domain protein [Sulfuriferula plumbiphila]
MNPDWIVPDWPASAQVRALVTTRAGGVSTAPYAGLNLGDHVGDDPARVAQNRTILRASLPAEPVWLKQVHGIAVFDADSGIASTEADASVTRQAGPVCAVLTADCLPVLFCDRDGSVVAAAHAGWRGLVGGVLEATAAAMQVPADSVMAWLGPAIGAQAFEVGDEVREAFVAVQPEASAAFVAQRRGKWLADIYALARLRLQRIGVTRIYGGGACTYSEPVRFYSYRRDGATGRMASLIWLQRDGTKPAR